MHGYKSSEIYTSVTDTPMRAAFIIAGNHRTNPRLTTDGGFIFAYFVIFYTCNRHLFTRED